MAGLRAAQLRQRRSLQSAAKRGVKGCDTGLDQVMACLRRLPHFARLDDSQV